MLHPADGRQFTVPMQPTDAATWKLLLLIALPMILLRLWMLSLPLPYYDFHTYWFAGHLFVSGGHPYSEASMHTGEFLDGKSLARPQVMLCPPYTLPFLGILATLPVHLAQRCYLIASVTLNCFTSMGLWLYFGGRAEKAWIAILVILTFLPMGGAEFMGQITPVILGCLTGFLLLVKMRKYFVAGTILLGFGIKPHLLYLVLLAVLAWIVQQRAWPVLVGAAAAYGAATAAAFACNPTSLDYFHHTYSAAIATPCGVGALLRDWFGSQHSWLQFLPCLLGVAWFLSYWRKHYRTWNWQTHLPLLLVVSISTAPYNWYHDFILILPAIMAIAVTRAYRSRWVLMAYLCTQAAVILAGQWSPAWMSFASLLWIGVYWIAQIAPRYSTSPSPGGTPCIL